MRNQSVSAEAVKLVIESLPVMAPLLKDEELIRKLSGDESVRRVISILPGDYLRYQENTRLIYIILKGEILVIRRQARTDRGILFARRNAGQTIGEISLLSTDDAPQSAIASEEDIFPLASKALSDGLLLCFTIDVFVELIKHHHEFALYVIRCQVTKLQYAAQRLDALVYRSSIARVAEEIWDRYQLDKGEVNLPSQKELAAWLALEPATVSRDLTLLNNNKIIEIVKRQRGKEGVDIKVLDVDALDRLRFRGRE